MPSSDWERIPPKEIKKMINLQNNFDKAVKKKTNNYNHYLKINDSMDYIDLVNVKNINLHHIYNEINTINSLINTL